MVDPAVPFRVLSLFTGIGGMELGLRLAVPHARTVCMVEREASAAALLAEAIRAGEIDACPLWLDDVERFEAAPWRGRVDWVASADPCQPNSTAGRKRGRDDERWLIDDVLRVVGECRPVGFFRENVAGNAEGQLEALVPPLERMGYRVAAGMFSASEVGAPHHRERLFVMGHSDGLGREWGCPLPRLPARPVAGAVGAGAPVVGDQPPFPLHPRAAEWRGAEPAVRRGVDGIPNRVDRIRALGNAVMPVVVANAFVALYCRLCADRA